MASTPSINPTQASARNTEEGERFNHALFATLDALDEEKISFGLIGGVAVSGLGRPRSTHDIDIFVRPEDAEGALRALEKHGFRTERLDIEWLFKAYLGEVMVDVIFRSKGDIYFDEEMQAHRRQVEYHGRKVPVVSPEDLVIIKAAVHYEGGPHHWHDALAILSHSSIDWNYLLHRARRAPRRLLALLIYAQSSDILIPNHVISNLYGYLFSSEARPAPLAPGHASPLRVPAHAQHVSHAATPDYVVAHICESLKEDGRTAQQDVRVLLDGQRVVIEGSVPSEASRKALGEVAGQAAPGYSVENRVQISCVTGPEAAEEIS